MWEGNTKTMRLRGGAESPADVVMETSLDGEAPTTDAGQVKIESAVDDLRNKCVLSSVQGNLHGVESPSLHVSDLISRDGQPMESRGDEEWVWIFRFGSLCLAFERY